jgi:hypothetical protein
MNIRQIESQVNIAEAIENHSVDLPGNGSVGSSKPSGLYIPRKAHHL